MYVTAAGSEAGPPLRAFISQEACVVRKTMQAKGQKYVL